MNATEFQFAPPGRFAQAFPLLIGLGVPFVVVAVLLLSEPSPHWRQALPPLLLLPLAMAGMSWAVSRRRFRLRDGRIRYGLFPWRNTPIAALDLEAARIVNLEQQRELQPVWRIAGTALPGYRSGWFRLRDRQRAYLVLSDWRRVLVLPKRDGGLLLFSLQRPDAVLDALRRAQGHAPHDSLGRGR